ncbi:MAG TPA: hypothetical protein VFZ09_28110 [Archangium sp.]|nr:hypothetical protein [Archangium sp.]HEX5750127.1 hypothetical protein [Archangium sp.]
MLRERARHERFQPGASPMDLVLVLVTVGFFALAWAYTRGCERL